MMGLLTAAAPVIGAMGHSMGIDRGMRQFANTVGQGTDVMNQGKAGSDAAFQPWVAAGQQGLAAGMDDILNRTQATQPQLSNINPESARAYLDPSAAYSADQANKATTAAAIAGGGMGGGMMKALSNNANKFAQTNWNNAFSQMQDAANTNFGQQQQQYQNTTDFDQSQIQNKMGLSGTGLTATSTNQGNQLGYNTGINDNYNAIANARMAGNAAKGSLFNSAISGKGGLMSSLASFL